MKKKKREKTGKSKSSTRNLTRENPDHEKEDRKSIGLKRSSSEEMKSSGLSILRLMFLEEKDVSFYNRDFSRSHLNKSLINPKKETKLFHFARFFLFS